MKSLFNNLKKRISKLIFVGIILESFLLPLKTSAALNAGGDTFIKNQSYDSIKVEAATDYDSTNDYANNYGGWAVGFPNTPVGSEERFYFRKQIGSTVYKGKIKDPNGDGLGIAPVTWLYDSTATPVRTFNVFQVIDTSNVDTLLQAIVTNLNTAQTSSMYVDTSGFYEWQGGSWVLQPHRYDIYVPLEGDDGHYFKLELEKRVNDITWKTVVDSVSYDYSKYWDAIVKENPNVDPWLAQYDTVYFPLEKIVNDTTKPSISNITEWPDTNFAGPYPVQAEIYDAAGIGSAWLKYKLNQSPADSSEADSIISNNYWFTVDTTADAGDSVFYKLKAVDGSSNQNEAYWPGPSADNWYSFKVIEVGAEEAKARKEEFEVWPSIVRNKLYVKGTKQFSVHDIAGRKIKSYEANTTGTYGFDVPSGIYFVSSEDKTKKVIKVK